MYYLFLFPGKYHLQEKHAIDTQILSFQQSCLIFQGPVLIFPLVDNMSRHLLTASDVLSKRSAVILTASNPNTCG